MTTGAIINPLQEVFVRQENIKAPSSSLGPNTGAFLTDIPDLFPANGDFEEDSKVNCWLLDCVASWRRPPIPITNRSCGRSLPTAHTSLAPLLTLRVLLLLLLCAILLVLHSAMYPLC